MYTPITKELLAIADYDNINKDVKRKGLRYIIESLTLKIPDSLCTDFKKIKFRLYGGWYENNLLTSIATN